MVWVTVLAGLGYLLLQLWNLLQSSVPQAHKAKLAKLLGVMQKCVAKGSEQGVEAEDCDPATLEAKPSAMGVPTTTADLKDAIDAMTNRAINAPGFVVHSVEKAVARCLQRYVDTAGEGVLQQMLADMPQNVGDAPDPWARPDGEK